MILNLLRVWCVFCGADQEVLGSQLVVLKETNIYIYICNLIVGGLFLQAHLSAFSARQPAVGSFLLRNSFSFLKCFVFLSLEERKEKPVCFFACKALLSCPILPRSWTMGTSQVRAGLEVKPLWQLSLWAAFPPGWLGVCVPWCLFLHCTAAQWQQGRGSAAKAPRWEHLSPSPPPWVFPFPTSP